MPDVEYAIQIENLVRNFGRTDAVDGLSLAVRPGRGKGKGHK